MIQAQIYNSINQSADVIALAGNRVYPIRLPQESALPAVVYQISSIVPVNSLSGDSGIEQANIEVTAWAKDYLVAHELAYAARKALIEESGLSIITEAISDSEDIATQSYSVSSIYSVWYENLIGASMPSIINPIYEFKQYEFQGDGTTVDFTFPERFRSGSLVVYINGIVAKKSMYVEKTGKDGIIFNTAPAGGGLPDELLAFYAKV